MPRFRFEYTFSMKDLTSLTFKFLEIHVGLHKEILPVDQTVSKCSNILFGSPLTLLLSILLRNLSSSNSQKAAKSKRIVTNLLHNLFLEIPVCSCSCIDQHGQCRSHCSNTDYWRTHRYLFSPEEENNN